MLGVLEYGGVLLFVPLSHCTTLILPSIPIDEYSLSSTRMPRPPDLKKLPRPPILHLFKHIHSSTSVQQFLYERIEPFPKYNYVQRREASAHLYEPVRNNLRELSLAIAPVVETTTVLYIGRASKLKRYDSSSLHDTDGSTFTPFFCIQTVSRRFL